MVSYKDKFLGVVFFIVYRARGQGDGLSDSCSSVGVKLPSSYNLSSVILGSSEGRSQSLDEMRTEGYDYAAYMQPDESRSGGAIAAKFINFLRVPLDMYWDNGSKEGVYSGNCGALGRSSTTTYPGHAFKFVNKNTKELVVRLVMTPGINLYIIEPEENDLKIRQSQSYLKAKHEAQFLAEYYQTHGIPWLSKINRSEPLLNMWPADGVGQRHSVVSQHGFWTDEATQSQNPVSVDLVVLSKNPEGPRVMVIEDLISDYECDHIIQLGKKAVRRSSVGQGGGAFKSDTRTSSTGWITRSKDELIETLHKRFADVLGIDESLLHTSANAEDLQVVHYGKSQKYSPHVDFNDDGDGKQRFLTLLLYIHPPDEGGHTSFPKAHNGRGLRVKPPKGSAVLFYSMRPDGNGDDLSLHAGEPVRRGEKWVTNLWIWDPMR